MSAMLLWPICLGVALPVAVLALECLVGNWRGAEREEAGVAPPFAVLMPAHDEAAGIARSITDVMAQLRPCDRLLVVADNCSDATAAIARGLGAWVIERHDPAHRGKAHALEHGRIIMGNDPLWHDRALAVAIIVDADCSPQPGALQRLARTCAGAQAVVQGAYLLVPPTGATPVVRMSCFAFMVKNLVRQIALRRLAGTVLLQGSGMAFPMRVFRRLDWTSASLVEDLDMGMGLVLGGVPVTFDEHALFSSAASSQSATAGQRRRWEHGMMLSMRLFAPRLLKAALLGRPRLAFLALDQIVPPTVLLLLIAGLATGLGLIMGGLMDEWAPVLILLLCDLALAVGLTLAWVRHGRTILPWRAVIGSIRYLAWKLPIFAQFFTQRQSQWVRTDRTP